MYTFKFYFFSVACIFVSFICAKDHWSGEDYAKNSSTQRASAIELVHTMKLTGHEIILDVGCGDGKVTSELSHLVPQGWVIGIDSSPSMIHTAQKTYAHFSNLTFCLQDVATLDFKSRFDVITSFSTMQWVLEQEKALHALSQALKPGGQLLIQIPTDLPRGMEMALRRTLSDDAWRSYFVGFSPPCKFYHPDEYKQLLLNAPLVPTRIEVSTKNEIFSSRVVFQRFLEQWFPYLRALPDKKKEAFLSDLLDEYFFFVPLHEDGSVNFTLHKLEVEALK